MLAHPFFKQLVIWSFWNGKWLEIMLSPEPDWMDEYSLTAMTYFSHLETGLLN